MDTLHKAFNAHIREYWDDVDSYNNKAYSLMGLVFITEAKIDHRKFCYADADHYGGLICQLCGHKTNYIINDIYLSEMFECTNSECVEIRKALHIPLRPDYIWPMGTGKHITKCRETLKKIMDSIGAEKSGWSGTSLNRLSIDMRLDAARLAVAQIAIFETRKQVREYVHDINQLKDHQYAE